MNIFGLTPIDAALSAFGLNSSQKMTEFIFFQTPVGLLGFTIGFLWSLWESMREATIKYFAVFIFIAVAGFFLCLIPKSQESTIKSALEVYGVSTITAQSIHDTQTTDQSTPTVLSFIGKLVDSINLGAISVLDQALDNKVRFLSNPFGPQRLSLEANTSLHAPLADVHLKQDLDNFIYAHYLPSLIIYRNSTHHISDLHELWPGDDRIITYYTSSEKQQWEDLKDGIKHLINDPQSPWVKIKDLLESFRHQEDLDDQIMASLIRSQRERNEERFGWQAVTAIHTFFPYFIGYANFCIYITFPLLLLILLIIRRMSLFLRYMEVFLWAKSLYLISAMSYYISIVTLRVQAQTQLQSHWFWDYPYFAAVASILLCLVPVFAWAAIHYAFQLINNRH